MPAFTVAYDTRPIEPSRGWQRALIQLGFNSLDRAVGSAVSALAVDPTIFVVIGRSDGSVVYTSTELKAGLGQPAFLGAVLDHLLGDEALLLAFAEAVGIAPELPAAARRLLP